ncbi:hypothetical protein RQP46_001221 [Phenoliferia psychrophenolica]
MDLDDDLLALAEGTSTKRKSKSQGGGRSKPKRSKRPAQDSASDMDMSSDDSDAGKRGGGGGGSDGDASDDDRDDDESQFPLEGKYIDEADRAKILAMPELDREGILGDRAEQLNAAAQRKDLRRMVKEKERAEGGGSGADDGQRGALRERKATGATREKAIGIEKLKKRREEKGKQKERRGAGAYDDEPSSPRRRSSPGNYSDDEEDGEVDRYDKKSSSSKKAAQKGQQDVAGPELLKSVTVTRSKLAEFCAAPWFESWVKGAWVRYLIGQDDEGQPRYRLCQVEGVTDYPDHPYKIENVKTTLQLTLRFGSAVRSFEMSAASDSPPTDREFGRLSSTLTSEKMSLPLEKDLQRVLENLNRRKEYTMTEADLSAALAKKGVNPSQSKARLIIQRDFAKRNEDMEAFEQAQAQLDKLEAPPSPGGTSHESEADRMKKLNEHNRAKNRAEIKKAETRGQDERRRQAAALARGDAGVKVDASARVKTLTRLTYDRGDTPSRPSTPTPGTPTNGLATPPPGLAKHKPTKIEEVAKSVAIDLDDLDF